MTDIRDKIRRYLDEHGVKQAEAARCIGLSRAKLNATLHKRRKLETDEFFRLCDVLGVSADELRNYGEAQRQP